MHETIKQTLGTQLKLPDSLILYTPFPESQIYEDSPFLIYTLIDASCGACISSINDWQAFHQSVGSETIKLWIIVKSNDNFEKFKFICESGIIIDFPYPFLLDAEDKYSSLNLFMSYSKDFETVLTDRNNKILLIGNPIANPKIENLYVKIIKNELKE